MRTRGGRAACGMPAPMLALAWLFAVSCGGGPAASIPTTVVSEGTFEIEISGRGELVAATSTPIEVPAALPGAQRVVLLLDDGTRVEKGELIARLDGDSLHRRMREIRDTIRSLGFQLRAMEQALEKERRGVEASLAALEQEKADAETFAPRNEELFSRNEIIDARVDLELLQTKIELARSRLERYVRRARAEMEILRLQRRTEELRLSQLEQAQAALDVRAPHDGVFFRAVNWRGEKMSVGTTVWSGAALGELPDLSRMEARLHVLESEAAGLEQGLRVDVVLDAHPDRRFAGTVANIEAIANPIEPGSPVKYFALRIDLDRTDTSVMKPRSQVGAAVFVARRERVISIPNQALFRRAGTGWVWVRGWRGFERRTVGIGERSPSRTVITRGLEPGDVIALSDPEAADEVD